MGGNKADDGGWVLVWGVRRVGWECYVMEWGVKSLFWGVLSNRVCRDIEGVYIESLGKKNYVHVWLLILKIIFYS